MSIEFQGQESNIWESGGNSVRLSRIPVKTDRNFGFVFGAVIGVFNGIIFVSTTAAIIL